MVRDQILSVRMSESERQGLKQLAALLDQSPSATVRGLVSKAVGARSLAPALG